MDTQARSRNTETRALFVFPKCPKILTCKEHDGFGLHDRPDQPRCDCYRSDPPHPGTSLAQWQREAEE